MQFYTRPVAVEAHRVPDCDGVEQWNKLFAWIEKHQGRTGVTRDGHGVILHTLAAGAVRVDRGYWLVKTPDGALVGVEPNKFAARYQPAVRAA